MMVTHNPAEGTLSLNPFEIQMARFGFTGGEGLASPVRETFITAHAVYEAELAVAGLSKAQDKDERAAALGLTLDMPATPEVVTTLMMVIGEWRARTIEPISDIEGIHKTPFGRITEVKLAEYTNTFHSLVNISLKL